MITLMGYFLVIFDSYSVLPILIAITLYLKESFV